MPLLPRTFRKRVRPAVLTAAWLLLLARPASAQYHIDSWTTEHGLPQSSINSILQTRDGFLWVTTFGGLARFDGARFRVFDTTTNPELPNNRLAGLREDGDGQLWVITQDRFLMRYRDGKFIVATVADGLPAKTVGGVFVDHGALCVGTPAGATVTWRNGRFVPWLPPANAPLMEHGKTPLGTSAAGAVWYRDDAGVHRYAPGEPTRSVVLPIVHGLYEDRSGRLWMRDAATLLCITGKTVRTYGAKDSVLPMNALTITEDPDGTLWFLEMAGLLRFRNGQFTHYTTADGLPDNTIRAVYQDREGTHWVGTEGGLARLTESPITAFTSADGLEANNTYPLLQDHTGAIWLGNWMGLTRYHDGVFEPMSARLGIGKGNTLSLFEDRGGALWVGMFGGVLYRVKDGKTTSYPASPNSPAVNYAIYQAKDEDLWFGCARGVARFHDGQFTMFTSQNGYAGGETHAFYDDGRGTLWLGGDAGLTRYERGVFTPVGKADGFEGRHVRTIHADASGTLWIGTYDTGLFRFRDGRFTRYTPHEGLPSSGAFEILEDDQARFWISSNAGIYRVARSELDDVASGKLRSVTAVPYGRNDGMPSQECNGLGQPAGIRARDGRLWFPTQHGVAVIDPALVKTHAEPPPVTILDLIVAGRPTNARDRIEITSGGTSIEARYAALTFIRPELAKFKYRMEGLDPDWVDAGEDRTARYPQLPYGTFTFRVIAANRDGVWNQQGASVAIVVVRPFWRTSWFTALAVMLVAFAGFGVHRWRLGLLQRQHDLQETFARQLIESQEIDRRRIASELHDGLSQSLIVIKNWALISERALPDDHAIKPRLGEIAETASHALTEVREAVQDLVPYHLERLGLAASLHEMAARIGDASGLQIACRFDDMEGRLPAGAQMSLFRVAQEGLNNVAKHSGASEASIEMTVEGRMLRLTVRDNGKGFAPASDDPRAGRGGFGLIGMSERTRMMGGTMTIDSAPGTGTVIAIALPLDAETGGPA